jgi:MFS transporter, VNT family, synaptic vesicle glycoprotein 2
MIFQDFATTQIVLDSSDSTAKKSENTGFRLMMSQTAELFKKSLIWNTVRASLIMFGLFSASSGFFLWQESFVQ